MPSDAIPFVASFDGEHLALPKRQTFHSIQTLRGIAALMVVLFHLLPGRYGVGAAGVDVFFVISGFIMGTVGVDEAPGEFLRKRFARIAPLYWLLTLAMCFGGWAGLFLNFPFDARRILLSLLFIPYVDADGNIWPLLVPGWTLNYEMFFYLIFTVGLAWRLAVPFTLIGLLIAVGAGLVFAPQSAVGATWTSPLLLEFLVGLMLAQSNLRWPGGSLAGSLLMTAAIAAFALSAPMHQLLGGEYWVITWGVPAMAIVAGAIMVEQSGRWPSALLMPIERLGDTSYSLYLTHGMVLAVGHRLLGEKHPTLRAIPGLPVAVALGFASYYLIEKPSTRAVRRIFAML
jgi:exopolysaccharide production protein ExoZ